MSDTTKATEGKETATQATAAVPHGHIKKEEPKPTTGSSIFPIDPQFPKQNQFLAPTWSLLTTLVVCFFILKFFIYIKDEKRHGK